MSSTWREYPLKGDVVWDESKTLRVNPQTLNPCNGNGIVTNVVKGDDETVYVVTYNDGDKEGLAFNRFEGRWNSLRSRWDIG